MPKAEHADFHANYLTAKTELERWLVNQPLESAKRQHTQKIIEQIEKLKKDDARMIPELTSILNDTMSLLNHSMSPDAYKAKAQKVQGNPSVGMKAIGVLMIVLGAIVAGACAILAATVGIVFSGEGLTGAGILAAGIGLFAGGMRSGLSQSMNDLADDVQKHAP